MVTLKTRLLVWCGRKINEVVVGAYIAPGTLEIWGPTKVK